MKINSFLLINLFGENEWKTDLSQRINLILLRKLEEFTAKFWHLSSWQFTSVDELQEVCEDIWIAVFDRFVDFLIEHLSELFTNFCQPTLVSFDFLASNAEREVKYLSSPPHKEARIFSGSREVVLGCVIFSWTGGGDGAGDEVAALWAISLGLLLASLLVETLEFSTEEQLFLRVVNVCQCFLEIGSLLAVLSHLHEIVLPWAFVWINIRNINPSAEIYKNYSTEGLTIHSRKLTNLWIHRRKRRTPFLTDLSIYAFGSANVRKESFNLKQDL